ncbi:MAG: hypothetical protein RBU37_04210 [Myxococcota bacterium]|nr:hypothetical protein [Myxococcota bacterium]
MSRGRWLLAALVLLAAAVDCSSDQLYEPPVSLCNCNPDEICVNETCVLPSSIPLPSPDSSDESCQLVDVKINEFRYFGVDTPDFIELRAQPSAQLRGYRLLAYNAEGERALEFMLDADFDAQGLWVAALGQGLEQEPDLLLGDVGFAAPSGNILLFACDGTLLDAVGYGDFEASQRFAGEGAPAPSTGAEQSLARCPSEQPDSDDNAADFTVDAASPGEPNLRLQGSPFCTPCDAALHRDKLWFDELFYDPLGADDEGAAFVELIGEPGLALEPVVLEGWDEPSRRWQVIASLSATMGQDGRLLLAEDESVAGAQLLIPEIDAPNDAGGFRLLSCGEVLDVVVFGALAEPSAAGVSAEDVAEDVDEGSSLSRCPAQSGPFVATLPTPGEESVCP